jgi:hypothetical protein
MLGASEPIAGLKELIERFFAEANGSSQATFKKYIELERALLEQYQKYLADQMATHDDVLQNFTKLMMSSCLQIVAFQREHRTRFLELQSAMADAHLRFLERISENMGTPPAAPAAPAPPESDHVE